MALIKCPECGRERVSDSAESCPDCGYGIRIHFERMKKNNTYSYIDNEEKTDSKEKKQSRDIMKKSNSTLKKGLIIFVMFILVVTSIMGYKQYVDVIKPQKDYDTALSLMANGNFQEAKTIFKQLDTFKDASKKLEECEFELLKFSIMNGTCEDWEGTLDYLFTLEINEDIRNMQIQCLWQLVDESKQKEDYMAVKSSLEKMYSLDETVINSEEYNILLYSATFEVVKKLYNDGDFENVVVNVEKLAEIPTELKVIYDKSKIYCRFQGLWIDSMGVTHKHTGWDCAIYLNGQHRKSNEEGKIKNWIIEGDFLVNKIGNTKIKFVSDDKIVYLDENGKYSTYFERLEEMPTYKKVPALGMTAEEVKNSTWGNPEDKNITTYEWGTKEQWCYPGYRYIYFENGIVTSISE